MRGEILNFWVVNTTWCSRKVLDWIGDWADTINAIFLDLPRDFESFFKKRSRLEALKEKLDAKLSQQLNSLSPLVNFAMDEEVEIYCYKDSLHSISENSTSFEILTLVLKARLGKIDLDEWRKAILTDIEDSFEFAEYEANYIMERAGRKNVCINLNDEIEKALTDFNFNVKRVQLYSFNRPIDKIYSLIREELNENIRKDPELMDLIKKHVRFIDDVIEKGYEEACRIWEIRDLS